MTPFFFAWMYTATAVAQPVTLDGYAEWRILYFSQGHERLQLVERIRPKAIFSFQDTLLIHTTLDLSLWQGRDEHNEIITLLKRPIENTVPPSLDGTTWSFSEINEECEWDLDENNTVIHVQSFFDRLHLDLRWNHFDIRIGRQAVSWGSALFINPSDPVPQTLIETPWQERAGIDALYIKRPLTKDEQLSFKFLATQTLISGQLSFFLPSWEGNFVGVVEENHHRWGLNINGDHVIGWWAEFVWQQEEASHLKANIGIDYTFPILDGVWTFAQLYHDGSGNIPALYEWNKRQLVPTLTDCPSLGIDVIDAGFPQRDTLGRWYTLSGQQTSFWDDWSFQSIVFFNLEDQTGIHSQFISWRGDFLEAKIGLQQRFGTQGEFAPPSLQTTFMGEDVSDAVPSWRIMSWLRYSFAL